MFQTLTANQEDREDLFYGQVVVILARWFLILAGVVLALWTATSVEAVVLPIGFMIVLMGMNFYLHGRYLMRQPVQAPLVYLSSAVDLIVITLIVVFWTQGRGTGLASPFFVFYYPALLAFALIFPLAMTLLFTAAAVWLYTVVSLGDPWRWLGLLDSADTQVLVARLISLVAVAVVANYYARVEAERRDAYAGAQPLLGGERGAAS